MLVRSVWRKLSGHVWQVPLGMAVGAFFMMPCVAFMPHVVGRLFCVVGGREPAYLWAL